MFFIEVNMETACFSYIDACGFNSLLSLHNPGLMLCFYDKYVFHWEWKIVNHTTNILVLPASRWKYVKPAIFLLFKNKNKQKKITRPQLGLWIFQQHLSQRTVVFHKLSGHALLQGSHWSGIHTVLNLLDQVILLSVRKYQKQEVFCQEQSWKSFFHFLQ